MEKRFNVSDMIYQGLLTKEVVRKIELHHLPILNSLKSPITSIVGYRSFTYEISKGRDGTSQHTFVRRGAVDIASPEMWKLWKELKDSPYTRICFYGTFFSLRLQDTRQAVFHKRQRLELRRPGRNGGYNL